MKYKTRNDHLLEKHGDLTSADCMAEATKPDLANLADFLAQQQEQCRQAADNGVDDYRWERLRISTNNATDALQTGASSQIAIAFFNLGQAANDLCHLSDWERAKLYRAAAKAAQYEVEKLKRERALIFKNGLATAIKEIAQRVALMRWEVDTAEEIRLGEMCGNIFAEFCEASKGKDWEELLPDTSEGIKPWLREVAPDYAKKQGRPKKKKE